MERKLMSMHAGESQVRLIIRRERDKMDNNKVQIEFVLEDEERELIDKYLALLSQVNNEIAKSLNIKKELIALLGQLWKSACRRVQMQDKAFSNLIFPTLTSPDGNVLFANINKNVVRVAVSLIEIQEVEKVCSTKEANPEEIEEVNAKNIQETNLPEIYEQRTTKECF